MKKFIIGIVVAMSEEFENLKNNLKKLKPLSKNIFEGYIKNTKVFVCVSGIGKINAASATTELILKYNVNLIINYGLAGGIKKDLKINDIVISTSVSQFDFDLKVFGHKHGQVPGDPEKYISQKVRKKYGVLFGEIISADRFSTIDDHKDMIHYFPNAIAVDMESAAVGKISHKYNKPYFCVRIICDIIAKQNNLSDYNKNVFESCEKVSKLVIKIIEEELQ